MDHDTDAGTAAGDEAKEGSLSQQLRLLCGQEELSDVVFEVGSERQRFHGHRLIFAARSIVFKALLYGNFLERTSAVVHIPDVRPAAFEQMVHFLYHDKACVDEDTVIDTLFVAKKYDLPLLITACIDYLECNVEETTVFGVLDTALVLDDERLIEACMAFLRRDVSKLLLAESYLGLISQRALERIVRDDDVYVQELVLFDLCLAWSRHVLQSKSEEPTFAATAVLLESVLPHIRFPLMSLQDIATSVVPSGVLSDRHLVDIYTCLVTGGRHTTEFCSRLRQPLKPPLLLYRSGRSHANAIGNWGFSGAVDAVTVEINHAVWLHGLGIFPGQNGGLSGKVCVRLGAQAAGAEPPLAEERFQDIQYKGEETVILFLRQPLILDSGTRYTLIQQVEVTPITARQFQGSRQTSAKILSEDVLFSQMDAAPSTAYAGLRNSSMEKQKKKQKAAKAKKRKRRKNIHPSSSHPDDLTPWLDHEAATAGVYIAHVAAEGVPRWAVGGEPVRKETFAGAADVPDLAVDPDTGLLSLINTSKTSKTAYVTVEHTCVDAAGAELIRHESDACVTFVLVLPPRYMLDVCFVRPEGPALRITSDIRPLLPQPCDGHRGIESDPVILPTLPLVGDGPFLCTQGPCGRLSHFYPETRHAIDLACPEGTLVVAVADGVVTSVQDSNTASGVHCRNLFLWNSLMLRLDAGGFVEYVHIRTHSARVSAGDHVAAGQPLCESGAVGFCPAPHLHIQAHASGHEGAPTVPIQFAGPMGPYTPMAGNFYPPALPAS